MFDFAKAGAANRCNSKHRWLWVPAFAGTTICYCCNSPHAPRRIVPVLQRRPYAAREPEAVDRCRRSQRFEAMQLDVTPLEAAFLQNVARRRIADPRAGNQVLDIEFLEGEIDYRTRRLGAKPLAPILDAQPVAEFRRVRLAPVDADHSDRDKITFDQEHGFGTVIRGGTDELDRMVR